MKLEPLSGPGPTGALRIKAQNNDFLRAINSHGETKEESNQGIDL
ncbi:MAG TPA: hypothetical protein VH599_21370 [Ktedonobacterales bacterium]|jgi:hypothetical protein